MFIPTTSLKVEERVPGTDAFGDTKDSYKLVRVGLGAHIAKEERTHFDPTSGRWETITKFRAKIPGSVTLETGQRVTDERTGKRYWVDHSYQPANFVAQAPTEVALTEV